MRYVFVTYLKKHLKGQIMVVCFVVEIFIIAFLLLGVEVEFVDGNLVSIMVLSSEKIYDAIFIKNLIEIITNFLISIFVFLCIIGASEFPQNLIKDPLLVVILTRTISKHKFYIARFFSLYLAYILNLFIFSLLISFIILLKSNFEVYDFTPLIVFVSFVLQFVVVGLFMSFVGSATSNSLTSAVFGILVYFVISPLLYSNKDAFWLIKVFYYMVPQVYAVKNQIINLVYGDNFDFFDFGIPLITSVLYFLIGMEIFNRKEL